MNAKEAKIEACAQAAHEVNRRERRAHEVRVRGLQRAALRASRRESTLLVAGAPRRSNPIVAVDLVEGTITFAEPLR